MSEYRTIIGISAGLLFVLFAVGLGAGEYIAVDDTGQSNFTFTQEQLDVNLGNGSYTATYYDSSDDSIKVNETEYEDLIFAVPSAQFDTGLSSIDAIQVTMDMSNDSRVIFSQGLSVRDLEDGTQTLENFNEDNAAFGFEWRPTDSGVNESETLNATVEQVTLLPNSEVGTQSFIDNVSTLFEFSVDNPFISKVLLPALFLALGLIIIKSLPFFG